MSGVSFVGRVCGNLHYHRTESDQPFLCFYMRLRGPRKEGDTDVRVVVYGVDADWLYQRLIPGKWVEVQGRYRVRMNPKGRERTAIKLRACLQSAVPSTCIDALVEDILAALGDKPHAVHEIVAFPNLVRPLPVKSGV